MHRRWRWTPRRCLRCHRWLPRHKWRLGLTYCSGACFRHLYGSDARSHTERTGHATTMTLTQPWTCTVCDERSLIYDLPVMPAKGSSDA